MKASELRIGNLIQREGFGTQFVLHIKGPVLRTDKGDTPIRVFSGIPLTEEWLVKLGFKEINDDGLWEHEKEELFQVVSAYLNEKWEHVWDSSFTDSPIQYVHQLQNLFLALTGEELTLQS